MFERFTGSARVAVVLARDTARELGHNYIGTEHLLVGLIEENHGVAAQALTQLGFTADDVREQIKEIIGSSGESSPLSTFPLTSRVKKTWEASLREALVLGDDYQSTEHLLLGLLRGGSAHPPNEGVAAQILARRVDLMDVRETVMDVIAQRRQANDLLPDATPGARGSLTISDVPVSQFCALWDAIAAILPEAVPAFQISARETD